MNKSNVEIITSKENECIKRLKKIQDKKYRDEFCSFLVEGVKIVEEIISSYPSKINLIIFSQQAIKKYHNLYKNALKLFRSGKIGQVILVSERISEYISTTDTPQGVYAEVKFIHKKFDSLTNYDDIVVLDTIQDPGNLGTIIRSVDAFGFKNAVILEGSVDIYNPKVIRASMGSLFHIDIFKDIDKYELVRFLKSNCYDIYVTTPYGDNDISKIRIENKFAIVFGNESKGVDDIFMDSACKKLMIKMDGKAESLNAAIASAIVLYELNKKKKPSS